MKFALPKEYEALIRYRQLIAYLVGARNRTALFGTVLGRLWNALEPLGNIMIYYFLIVVLFDGRGSEGVNPFLMLVGGIAHYTFLSRALNTSVSSLVNNERLLLQLPIEPLVFIAVAFLETVWSLLWPLAIYGAIYVALGTSPSTVLLFYPVILVGLLWFTWCVMLLLASLGVFVRDLGSIVAIGARLMMYLSPVVYMGSLFPEPWDFILLFNPVACLFALLQWSLLGGDLPDLAHLTALGGSLLGVSVLGHWTYRSLCGKFTKFF